MEMFFLSYVNETMNLLGNLPFFKIHVNCFMAQDDLHFANIISKYMLWVRGLVQLSTSVYNVADLGSIPGLGRSPGEGKSHGWRSLVGYSPRGHKESNTTE